MVMVNMDYIDVFLYVLITSCVISILIADELPFLCVQLFSSRLATFAVYASMYPLYYLDIQIGLLYTTLIITMHSKYIVQMQNK
jgi:hypothetical protein